MELNQATLDQMLYRGEGNSSIVVALRDKSKVIRLLKKDGKIMKTSQDHHVREHPMRIIKYIHLIMRPLTDPFLSSATELVHLKSNFIEALSSKLESHRPMHRLDKTLLLDDQYAMVMDDLCALPPKFTQLLGADSFVGPTISVEIKPKQGFLPIYKFAMKQSTINEPMISELRNCCLYGSTQMLKLQRGRIRKASEYCPINLFSGCPARMRLALESLISNPQNNFRIFKDLVFAYGENKCERLKLTSVLDGFIDRHHDRAQHDNLEYFIDLLIQCLLSNHDHSDTTQSKAAAGMLKHDAENSFTLSDDCQLHKTRSKCRRCDMTTAPHSKKHKTESGGYVAHHHHHNLSSHELPRSCVLASVLRAQKLDTIGAHEASYMLQWLMSHRSNSGHANALEELSKPQMIEGFGSAHRLPHERQYEYYFRKVWEFLVSLTAKDCSIIITLRRLNPAIVAMDDEWLDAASKHYSSIRTNLLRDTRTGCAYLFNVGIADLDQKMPLKIPRICENLNFIMNNDLRKQQQQHAVVS